MHHGNRRRSDHDADLSPGYKRLERIYVNSLFSSSISTHPHLSLFYTSLRTTSPEFITASSMETIPKSLE
jgi:hypothetical protein